MKTLIFQYYSNNTTPDWVKESVKRFKKYASMTNSDYIFREKIEYSPECYFFEHLCLIYDDQFKKYDRILYVDVDVIVERFEENIFNQHIEEIGMVPEYKAPGMNSNPVFTIDSYMNEYKNLSSKYDLPFVKPKTVESKYLMFNSGVILWSREGLEKAREKFIDWKKWNKNVSGQFGLDQPFLNGQVTKHLNYTELPLKWNCFPRFRFEKGKAPNDAVFVHYTGGKKKFIEEIYGRYQDEN